MAKAILFTRVSTERQSLDDQLKELTEFAYSQNYSPNDILIIEGAGASAIKLNDAYTDMISKVKEAIKQDPNIEVVFLWALDRFGRNDEILIKMKNWFITNKINLIIKNPHLVLLNPDKTINSGTELTYNILATIAKQEMESKFARFKRSKQANTRLNRFNGGKIPTGYIVNSDGFFEPAPDNIIQKIFTLYSTGTYSYSEILHEVQTLGFLNSYDTYTGSQRIHQILHNPVYIGKPNKFNRTYPPLVTPEIFNTCQEIAKKHSKHPETKKNQQRIYPCRTLVKCPHCGKTLVANTISAAYVCNTCHTSISLNMIESLTWWAISPLYTSYLIHKNDAQDDKNLQTIELLNKKIKVLQNEQNDLLKRIDTIQDKIYIEAKISIEKGEQMINQLNSKINTIQKQQTEYKQQIENLIILSKKPSIVNIYNVQDILNITDTTTRYNILHEFVKSIIPYKQSGFIHKIKITLINETTLEYTINTRHKLIYLPDNTTLQAPQFHYKEFLNRYKNKQQKHANTND